MDCLVNFIVLKYIIQKKRKVPRVAIFHLVLLHYIFFCLNALQPCFNYTFLKWFLTIVFQYTTGCSLYPIINNVPSAMVRLNIRHRGAGDPNNLSSRHKHAVSTQDCFCVSIPPSNLNDNKHYCTQ